MLSIKCLDSILFAISARRVCVNAKGMRHQARHNTIGFNFNGCTRGDRTRTAYCSFIALAMLMLRLLYSTPRSSTTQPHYTISCVCAFSVSSEIIHILARTHAPRDNVHNCVRYVWVQFIRKAHRKSTILRLFNNARADADAFIIVAHTQFRECNTCAA